MQRTRVPKRLLACLAAAAFVALETIALAHEVEHDLAQHDEPVCGLHLYIGHFGKASAAPSSIVVAPLSAFYLAASFPELPQAPRVLGYRGRAPPLSAST
jgi:hypothetical protein